MRAPSDMPRRTRRSGGRHRVRLAIIILAVILFLLVISIRGVAGFSYARDKTESDRICQLWAAQHPDRLMTIVRPCIVFGPNVDNYLVRLWTKTPFTADVGRLDQTLEYVELDGRGVVLRSALERLVYYYTDPVPLASGEGLIEDRDPIALGGVGEILIFRKA